MVDYATSHYDLTETIGHGHKTLDVFTHMVSAVDNDVIPESREDVVIAGTELNASTLGMTGNSWTTVPLKPYSKDVNFLYENYIHQQFEFKVQLVLDQDPEECEPITWAIYVPTASCLPSRYQLLVGNSPIWENTYQRLESIANIASVPQELVQTNPEVVTMSKLLSQEPIPGCYITPAAGDYKSDGNGKWVCEKDIVIDCNIDLNTFTPILSNLPFVTNFMGNLRLRLFYLNLERALCITPIPVNRKGLYEGFHTIEKLPFNMPFHVSFHKAPTNGTAELVDIVCEARLADWKAVAPGVEIIQANFGIKRESLEEMKAYIGRDNKLLIPTQTWAVTNSGQQPPNQSGGNEFVFQINAYNIHLLTFLFPYDGRWETYYPQPRMTGIDIKLNGKTINYIPYRNIGPRVYKDTAQAFLNDDKYGINENLTDSLLISGYTGKSRDYDATKWNDIYSQEGWAQTIRMPNNFVIAKGLSPPDCFECGYCNFNSNPQSTQIRFTYTLTPETVSEKVPGQDQSQNVTFVDNTTSMAPPDYTTSTVNPFCLALQDCCILLSYNPYTGTCQSGTVEYATPAVI